VLFTAAAASAIPKVKYQLQGKKELLQSYLNADYLAGQLHSKKMQAAQS
jgi:hypothetical protein